MITFNNIELGKFKKIIELDDNNAIIATVLGLELSEFESMPANKALAMMSELNLNEPLRYTDLPDFLNGKKVPTNLINEITTAQFLDLLSVYENSEINELHRLIMMSESYFGNLDSCKTSEVLSTGFFFAIQLKKSLNGIIVGSNSTKTSKWKKLVTTTWRMISKAFRIYGNFQTKTSLNTTLG